MNIVLAQKLFGESDDLSNSIKASQDLCRVCSGWSGSSTCRVFDKHISDTRDMESVECPVNKACLLRLQSVWVKMSFEEMVEEAKLRG